MYDLIYQKILLIPKLPYVNIFHLKNSLLALDWRCKSDILSGIGGVAQMVERSLSMWEVGGSIPPISKNFFGPLTFEKSKAVISCQTAKYECHKRGKK